MTINSKALVASGVEIGQAVFMEESQPIDLEFFGRRYLQSGYVETDMSLFDTSIFTSKTLTTPQSLTSSFATNTQINDITYGGGVYVAVGSDGQIASSDDGENWTQRTNGFGANGCTAVAYGEGLFVAVGSAGILETSPDGENWTTRVSSFSTTIINYVRYHDGLFIAGGNSGKIATSPDGLAWTQKTSGFGVSGIFDSAFDGTTYVIVGASGTAASSTDGNTWTLRATDYGAGTISSVDYGSGMFIAAGSAANILIKSIDGITWTKESILIVGAQTVWVVASNGSEFLLAGGNGNMNYSANGEDWSVLTSVDATSLRGALVLDNLILVGGNKSASPAPLFSYELSNYAGSTVAHAEFGEHQYIRIS